MRRNTPLFAGLVALLLLVFGILELIEAIKGLNSIGSATGSIASYAKGAITFELVLSIIIIISTLISLTMAITTAEDKSLFCSTGVVLTIFTLGSIIDTFVAYGLIKKIMGAYATFPGVGIAKLVFLFFTLLLLAIGLLMLGSYEFDSKGPGVLAGASASLVIVCIISFIAMDSNTSGLTIAAAIIFLFATLLSFAEYLSSYSSSFSYSNSSSNSNKYTYNEDTDSFEEVDQSQNYDNDASTQLRKLKSLLDDGIITTEEYEEKRKKYVDKL